MQQQFVVPQFIDVEDKIIGPVTTRQFVIMLVATLLMFISFTLLEFWLFAIVGFFIVVFFGVIAFLKVNGMPFHYFFLNVIQTTRRANIRVWNKTLKDSELKKLIKFSVIEEPVEHEIIYKKVSHSRLSKLSLIVNTGGVYHDDDLGAGQLPVNNNQ